MPELEENQSLPRLGCAQFTAPLDGNALLVVAASRFASTWNTRLQMEVFIDGAPVGTASLFSNQNRTHRGLPTVFLNVALAYGAHILTLVATGNGAVSDYNDFFGAELLF